MKIWFLCSVFLVFFIHFQDTMGHSSISVVARLDGVAYYMHQIAEVFFLQCTRRTRANPSQVDIEVGSNQIAEPCTVFQITEEHQFTVDLLRKEVARFERIDDVWSQPFLANIVLKYYGNEPEIHQDFKDLCDEWGTNQIYRVPVQGVNPAHHEGPYFLQKGRLHPAYRLYPDTAGAFVVGTVPTEENFKFVSLQKISILTTD